ncbi:MAG: hypothetical protein IPJ34_05160 [Myxococcales bacterium]|nr:hypothetical protein [Myxococcales bacterium]
MTPRTFRGNTLEEARSMASAALGDEAAIVATRRVPLTGLRGLVGAACWEVDATLEEKKEPTADESSQRRTPFALTAYAAEPTKELDEQFGALRAEVRRELREVKAALSQPAHELSALEADVGAMRETLEALVPRGSHRRDATSKHLVALGVEGPAAKRLSRAMRGAENPRAQLALLRAGIAAEVRTCPSPLAARGKTLTAVIGPSGVGKTTTLAKLAARERLERNRSVLLISCDGFRVGAIDQLERFAHLIGARFAVAHTAEELAGLIEGANEAAVMVDTSGRPPVPDGVEGLLARPIPGRERHVILCATAATRAVDAQRLARVFGPLRADALCVTKLDETEAPAGVLHMASATRLPVAILCNGQRVPEDLREATTSAIVDLLSPAAPASSLKEAS